MPPATGEWSEWSKHVLLELGRLGDGLEALKTQLTDERIHLGSQIADLKVQVATLQVKSGLWGGAAGLIPAIGALIYLAIKG